MCIYDECTYMTDRAAACLQWQSAAHIYSSPYPYVPNIHIISGNISYFCCYDYMYDGPSCCCCLSAIAGPPPCSRPCASTSPLGCPLAAASGPANLKVRKIENWKIRKFGNYPGIDSEMTGAKSVQRLGACGMEFKML